MPNLGRALVANLQGFSGKEKMMTDIVLKMWVHFYHRDDGATLVEYGIAILLAVAVGGGVLVLLGAAISLKIGEATAAFP